MIFFFIPYAVAEPIERTPVVTYTFLAINWLAFVVMFLTPMGVENLEAIMHGLGYVPGDVKPWGLVTYGFLHGGFFHILGNSVFLYLFGPYMEQKLGRMWFVGFYVVGGAAAAVAHHLFVGGDGIPLVGASGAIAALLGGFFCLRPWSDVRNLFFYWFILLIGTYRVNIPALIYMPVFFLYDNFVGATGGADESVAYWAHLGGFFFGYFLLLGLYGFTGWKEESEPQLWMKKRAREQKLKQAAGGSVSAAEEIAMNTRLEAANILNEIVGIGDPNLIVKAYHRAMAKYPDLMLEPGVQERMAGAMERGGYGRDALHALEKLIQNVPRSNAGQRAHLAAGKICAGIPPFYEKGRLYLREYLDNFVSAEKRLEAEALLLAIEESMRAQGQEPTPMRPVSPVPGFKPAVDSASLPPSLRPPNWEKTQAQESQAGAEAGANEAAPRRQGPMKTVVGVAASEADAAAPDMTIKISLDGGDAAFPDFDLNPAGGAFPPLAYGSREADAPRSGAKSNDEPAKDGFIPTTYKKTGHSQPSRVKRPMAPTDSQAPFAPPPGMKSAAGKIRPRLNTLEGSAMLRSKGAAERFIVALPRRAPTDWATLEGFLAHVWRCNKTEAKERLQQSRGILMRDVGEAEVADAEGFAQQFGIPLLVVRVDSFPNVRQPVDVSSMTLNEGGALIMSASKKHHVKWEEAALLCSATIRHGHADGAPLRVFDLICREPMRSYRGWEHLGSFSIAPDAGRIRFADGFEKMLRTMAVFAPQVEMGAGIDLTAGAAEAKPAGGGWGAKPAEPGVKLPAFNTLKEYNLYLEWHAIQLGSRLGTGE